MNMLSIRAKQILYGSIILGLFVVMVPYGDWLQNRKDDEDLGEAFVTEIDTGSFLLKLAMIGGMRGVVANVKWMEAQQLQRLQEWDRLKATIDVITKLQPHFLTVWTYQGWNLSYNVSVEWDDPADKYTWIKSGIEFLKEGVNQNPRSPDLTWDTAWTYYHKVGFSDESIIFRRLFFDDLDEQFKTDPYDGRFYNDNFQVARGWFQQAIEKSEQGNERLAAGFEAPVEYVDRVENRKGRPGDLAFRTMPAHAQTRYASALEKKSMVGEGQKYDAQFGTVARTAWERAKRDWEEFGEVEFNSPNALEIEGRLYAQPIKVGDALAREPISPEQWPEELKRAIGNVVPDDLVVSAEDAQRLEDNKAVWSRRWADQNNYIYWLQRCDAEMFVERDEITGEPVEGGANGVEARRHFYDGYVAYLDARFADAVDEFRIGLEMWEQVLDRFPVYRDDDLNQRDTGTIALRYVNALRQAGFEQPEEIPFEELIADVQADPTLDPFDALDMLGETGGTESSVGGTP